MADVKKAFPTLKMILNTVKIRMVFSFKSSQ